MAKYHACDNATGYADGCQMGGGTIDIFRVDLLQQLLQELDHVWVGWLTTQVNTARSVECVMNSLTSHGAFPGNLSIPQVGALVFEGLVELIERGPVQLDANTTLVSLIRSCERRIGTDATRVDEIAESCASENYRFHQQLSTIV